MAMPFSAEGRYSPFDSSFIVVDSPFIRVSEEIA
jgi:hypothetical protein